MSQRFIIEGNRKLGLNVTVAVEGVDAYEDPGWTWGWLLWMLVGIAYLAGLMMLIDGLPYYRTNSIFNTLGPGQLRNQLFECHYKGLQGERSLWFEDTQDCPSIVFMPWQEFKPVPFVPPPPTPMPPSKRDRRGKIPCSLSGPPDNWC